MTHLKRCGPIRAARNAKRTALVEIQGEEIAANDGDLSEQDLLEIDRSFAARKDADPFRTVEADRAQAAELDRMPGQGYLA